MNAQALCMECMEGITNPICPECLAMEMEIWNKKLKPIITVPNYTTYNSKNVRCLFCGKIMDICAHCFSRSMYELIKEKYPDLAEDFIDTFNYGLREELT